MRFDNCWSTVVGACSDHRLVGPEHLSVVFYSEFPQLYAAGQVLHVQQIFGHFEWNCAVGKFKVFQILNYF